MLGPMKSYLKDHSISIKDFVLQPKTLAQLIHLVDENKVSFSIASSRILPELLKEGNTDPLQVADKLNLLQISNSNEVLTWVEQALASMPDKVNEYKKGKKGLIGLFVGEVKKISKGKADPKIINQLLLEKLES